MNLIIVIATLVGMFVGSCKKDEPTPGLVTKIDDFRRLPIVKGTLNGQKANFILDTGATISVIDLNQLSKYKVRNGGPMDDVVIGYGGTVSSKVYLNNVEVKLGDLVLSSEFQGQDIGQLLGVIEEQTGTKLVGIIGNNNISKSKLTLDFKRGEVRYE